MLILGSKGKQARSQIHKIRRNSNIQQALANTKIKNKRYPPQIKKRTQNEKDGKRKELGNFICQRPP